MRPRIRGVAAYLRGGWHWKSAGMSAVVRALIFLFVNAPAGASAAWRAMLTELVFRACVSGVLGDLTQRCSRVANPWTGAAAALLAIPLIGHTAEYLVHSAAGTPRLSASMTASVTFTCLTTSFTFFLMRRGVLIVGRGQRSLAEDLRQVPRLVADFLGGGARAVAHVAALLLARGPSRGCPR